MSKTDKKSLKAKKKVSIPDFIPNDPYEFEPHVKSAIAFGVEIGKFKTKDSGKRQEFASGMRRDSGDDKPRYDLIEPKLLKRWAELMGRGAEKYGERNWELASSMEEMNRFKASSWRHFVSWANGWDADEDHAAAILFNVAAYEYVKRKINVNLQTNIEKTTEDRG